MSKPDNFNQDKHCSVCYVEKWARTMDNGRVQSPSQVKKMKTCGSEACKTEANSRAQKKATKSNKKKTDTPMLNSFIRGWGK